jgi:cation/acetate symporter
MVCGLAVTLYYMIRNEPGLRGVFGIGAPIELWWGILPVAAGAFGVPVGFAVAAIVSGLTPRPGPAVQQLIDDLRAPQAD